MKRADLFWLWIASLGISSAVAVFQRNPGYMDAEYYFATAQNLFAGRGFTEPFIWNYLNMPAQLPAPSYLYWMPLSSFLAYLGMVIGHNPGWFWGRLPFIIFTTLVPLLTYYLSWALTKEIFVARFAGWLALLPGFYAPYMTTTDTFVISMLLGSGWILATEKALRQKNGWIFLAGVLSGLLHLSRADGILWLILLIGLGIWECFRSHSSIMDYLLWILIPIGGYLIIMGGWYYRNWLLFQSVFPPGNTRALWLRNYDDLFSFPPEKLNFVYWWQNGIVNNLSGRWYALTQNLVSFLAVNGEIFLIGLLLLGAWNWRSKPISRVIWLPWFTFLILMSVIFPYAGYRGGFFHTAAAFQPLFWTFSGVGLVRFVKWGNRFRHWNKNQALHIFFTAGMLFAFFFTVLIAYQRVIGGNWKQPIWNEAEESYLSLCKKINNSDSDKHTVVMVNNPVGFYLACRENALAIPVGGIDVVRQVAKIYHVDWLIIEEDHPADLDEYYFLPHNFDGFQLVENEQDWKIFRFNP